MGECKVLLAGLSGGQKRRLSLAVALLSNPLVLFLDEPTTGLDAAAAASIMRFLKELAVAANIAIVCTIHQAGGVLRANTRPTLNLLLLLRASV